MEEKGEKIPRRKEKYKSNFEKIFESVDDLTTQLQNVNIEVSSAAKALREAAKENRKSTRNSRFIVIFTALLALTTLFLVCVSFLNVKQQGDFNKAYLRPWIGLKPGIKCNYDGYSVIMIKEFENVGLSPGISVLDYSFLTRVRQFPDTLVKEAKRKKSGKGAFLFPRQTIKKRESFDMRTFLLNEQQFFYHIYIEYSDYDHNVFGFQTTCSLSVDDAEKEVILGMVIYSSSELID